MVKLIFNIVLILIVFSSTFCISKRIDSCDPTMNAIAATIVVVLVDIILNLFMFADLPIFEKYTIEETKIQYNLNVETNCYQIDSDGITEYCILDEKGVAKYINKSICETEVSDENVLLTQTSRVKNKVLDLFFWMPSNKTYVLKTSDIKLIY